MTGRISSTAGSTIPVLEPLGMRLPEKITRNDQRPRMLGSRPTRSLPQSTMIGELKLTALKARLAKVGVQAELIGEGVLICGPTKRGSSEAVEHTVAVKKTTRGRVELEGTISDVYYVVRKEIYNLHALVAA